MFTLDKRPRQYKEVVGHKTIVNTFKEYTKDGRDFPQIILLEGTTGLGKSTLGNIISTSMTCEKPVKQKDGSYEPCLECDSCQDIIKERFSMDVCYRDASSMGKDDVLALENELSRGASYGLKKVILIEEAQELASKGAKGALLRLLEVSRKNTHIILMTMDKSVFPKAVIDRCQVFSFKKFSTKEIADYLMSILFEIDPNEELPPTFEEVIVAIADNAQGSMRSGLQQFQRCLDSKIYDVCLLQEELEIVSNEKVDSFIEGMLNGKATALYELGSNKNASLSNIFNKIWFDLVEMRKAYLSNSFYNEGYANKCKAFVNNSNFDTFLDTLYNIHIANSSYFNNNVFYYHITKYIKDVSLKTKTVENPVQKLQEEQPTRRRRLKVEN